MRDDIIAVYERKYGSCPEKTAFTPYRVCPLGAHVDHQLGKVTGFAIDKGIHMVYDAKTDGGVEVTSLQFDGDAGWHINTVPAVRQNDWADHLRGATVSLGKRFPLTRGIRGVITGELPIGGLSSSAAVIITFLTALCEVNGIRLTPGEMITVAKEAENAYVGVNCGKLDQACEIYCRKDELLYFDTANDSVSLLAHPDTMPPFKIAVFFSGPERSLVLSGYNTRVDECRSAGYALKAFAGMPYGKYNETHLREVPEDVFLRYKEKLPENWRKRAEHWYSEMNRVEKGVMAWQKGDIEAFGHLIFASGKSSVENYEAGSPELKKMYEIMTEIPGIYGGRFSGAGFKGCSVALINPAYEERILKTMETEYLKAFPHLRNQYTACICETQNGIGNTLGG